jgi:DNA-binding PadR family transcriptional regulator
MAALGEFELVVLMSVLHLRDGAYPPAVRREMEARTGRAAARGAVYVTLDRLEAKRLLASRLEEEGGGRPGRARRFYRVTPQGVRAIRRALDAIERMSAGLGPLLEEA